ncbi:MAG: hypothetical protein CVU39_07925 [Chloroflexi bacterium HGW-Chloroflexi-10]|nr:MAG: hypothetical protein CVU39_07925 [Chloroflexi bacterium HGW-Chloroflexi-10]
MGRRLALKHHLPAQTNLTRNYPHPIPAWVDGIGIREIVEWPSVGKMGVGKQRYRVTLLAGGRVQI